MNIYLLLLVRLFSLLFCCARTAINLTLFSNQNQTNAHNFSLWYKLNIIFYNFFLSLISNHEYESTYLITFISIQYLKQKLFECLQYFYTNFGWLKKVRKMTWLNTCLWNVILYLCVNSCSTRMKSLWGRRVRSIN